MVRLSKTAGCALLALLAAFAAAALLVPSSTFAGLLRLAGLQSECPLGYGGGGGGAGGSPHRRPGPAAPPRGADASSPAVVYINCSVWTGDPNNPRAQTFAVQGGRIAAVGSVAGPAARSLWGAAIQDLQGAFVIPGLIDPHVHVIHGGMSLSQLDLGAASSKAAFVAAVAAAAARLPPGAWLLGGNWDESRWGGEPPVAAWIDAATAHLHVFLTRLDSHQALANSRALALAGVTAATPDPPGGVIARSPGADGRPTGLLADAAMRLVRLHVPPASAAQRRAALLAAQAHALKRGITGWHDMGRVAFQEGEEAAWDDLEGVYVPAADDGALRVRLYAFVPLSTWRRLAERVRHLGTAHRGGRLSWGGVKEFADGSLGSRTALMHSPYADDPSNSGTRVADLALLAERAALADAAGLQLAVHAIGDRAVDDVLGVLEGLPPLDARAAAAAAAAGQGQRPRRHRVEHAQHLSGPGAAARMAAVGAVATPNPLHLAADAVGMGARLGAERAGAGRSYAFRTLLAAGVRLAFATDWPVVALDPLGALRAAVTRRGDDGGAAEAAVWGPEEAVTAEEALAAQTLGAAYAGRQERQLGSISLGKHADFVVLSADPLAAAGGGGARPEVLQTYVAGVCEYGCGAEAAESAAEEERRQEL